MKSFLEERRDHLRDASVNHYEHHEVVERRLKRMHDAKLAGCVLIFNEMKHEQVIHSGGEAVLGQGEGGSCGLC